MSNHQFNRDDVSIDIENMLGSMPATSPEQSIVRVLHQLHQVNEKAYESVILAIGPYHYGNDKFKFMEEQKLRYLQQLLKRKEKGSIDRYVLTLRELEQQVRNRYAEKINLSPEKFLAMMLIDGCFIVELFRKYNTKYNIPIDKDDPLMKSGWFRHYLGRDLLLLENQLPLFILSKLYDLTKCSGEPPKFSEVAIEYFNFESGGAGQNSTIGEGEHLLHLYHAWRTTGLPRMTKSGPMPAMPSAIELRESGVRFRAVQRGKLSDIKFKNGTLEIPVLEVEDETESKFRNLIAYEQQCQRKDIKYFTDYVDFMDHLINSSKDVEVLRHARIIKSYLGDDIVIAQMFNKMCDYVNISGPYSYYSKIFQNVNMHYGKRRNVWMSILRREYFHNPWASLSVLAAIVLLLLTATQTVFTILSYTE